jgi:hypothetical protein
MSLRNWGSSFHELAKVGMTRSDTFEGATIWFDCDRPILHASDAEKENELFIDSAECTGVLTFLERTFYAGHNPHFTGPVPRAYDGQIKLIPFQIDYPLVFFFATDYLY